MKKQHFLMSMLSLSISAVTYADEDTSSKVHQLSPIIVIGVDQLGEYTVDENANATGMEIALQYTPQSISVVTQQQMRDQNLFTVDKVLDNVIGVSKISQGNNPDTSYTYYYARGLEITNFVVDGTRWMWWDSQADSMRRKGLPISTLWLMTISRSLKVRMV